MPVFQYNQANDKAYQDILAGYKAQQAQLTDYSSKINNNYSQMIADNRNVGESDRFNLQRQYEMADAAMQQSLVSRGLGNTTVLDSAKRGNMYDYQNSLVGLNDSLYRRQTDLQNQQLGFQQQAAAGIANIGMAGLGYQGDALAQRYGAEANYVSQAGLQEQGSRLGLNAQTTLNQQQAQYQMNMLQQQQRYDDYKQRTYGFY